MIAHGYGGVKFPHYALDLYPINSNYIWTILVWSRETTYLSWLENFASTPLYEAMLDVKITLPKALNEHVIGKKIVPPPLCVQPDNCAKGSKSKLVSAYWSLLVVKGIFEKVFVSFSWGPHTQWFWCIFWAVENEVAWGGFPNNPTIDEVVHEIGQRSRRPIYDWGGAKLQSIIKTYFWSGVPSNWTHKGSRILVLHVWWWYFDHAIHAIVHNITLGPPDRLLVFCVDKEGKTMLPNGKPKPCKPIPMKDVKDIIKDISYFIQYWDHLHVVDVGGSFCHQFNTSIGYWIHICSTLMRLHQESPFLWGMVSGHKVMWMFLHWRLGFWVMGRFGRSPTRMTSTLGMLVTIPSCISML